MAGLDPRGSPTNPPRDHAVPGFAPYCVCPMQGPYSPSITASPISIVPLGIEYQSFISPDFASADHQVNHEQFHGGAFLADFTECSSCACQSSFHLHQNRDC